MPQDEHLKKSESGPSLLFTTYVFRSTATVTIDPGPPVDYRQAPDDS